MGKPALRLVEPVRRRRPPPTPRPARLTAPELEALLIRHCGHAPPPDLLDGPAGLVGTLEQWAPVLRLGAGPRRARPRLPAAFAGLCDALEERYSARLAARLVDELHTWAVSRNLEIAESPPIAERWAAAAAAIWQTVQAAYSSAELQQPRGRKLADVTQELLCGMGILRSSSSIRTATRKRNEMDYQQRV